MIENIIKKEKFKKSIITTFIFGMLAHGYCYFNFIASHDSLLVYQDDMLWQISLGRFMHIIYMNLRGDIVAPLLIGVLSLFYLAIAFYFTLEIFDLEWNIYSILFGGILTTNATLTLTNATYLHDSDIYMLALLCATLGVYFFYEFKYGFLASGILFVVSMGLYAAYIQVAIALFVIFLIKLCFEEVETKDIIVIGIKNVILLISSMLIYYGVSKLVIMISNVEIMETTNSLFGMSGVTLVEFLKNIVWDYLLFVYSFVFPKTYARILNGGINVALGIIGIILLFLIMKHIKMKKDKAFLAYLLVFLLPLAMNIIYVLTQGCVHGLMYYAYNYVYLLLIILLMKANTISLKLGLIHKRARSILIILLTVILVSNVVYSNQIYTKKDLEYQSTFSIITRVIDRMEQVDGYILGETPVLIVGTLMMSDYNQEHVGFEYLSGVGLSSSVGTTFETTYQWYFDTILGYPINLMNTSYEGYQFEMKNEEIVTSFLQDERVIEMPVYPAEDSVKMIDGYLIIKFSE